jgi:hypothetical protein
MGADLSKLRKFEQALRELPRTAGIKIAAAAAPALSSLARQTFDAGEDAYGNTWAPGARGQPITLRKTGALEQYAAQYVAIGTRLRVALGVAYAKYQIGKRPVFPRGTLPTAYREVLAKAAKSIIGAALGGGS